EGESKAVISSGLELSNWKLNTDPVQGIPESISRKLWVTDMPKVGGRIVDFRQLWVDGEKAKRATNLGEGKLDRILSVDNENEILWIPTPKWDFSNAEDLEFVIHRWWAIANLRVKSLEVKGDRTAVRFQQPESKIEFEHPWPAPFIDEKKEYNGNSAFFFSNAIELLNSPGEWFADYKTGKVYYWPREGEDMQKAEVIAPFLQSITKIVGSADCPVSHIGFKGITFAHTTWLRPSEKGHVPLQAGFYILDAYKLETPGTPDK